MVLKGVKAVYSSDKKTITTYSYPSKGGYKYKLTKKTWKNYCPLCKRSKTLKFNPKKVPEGELTCKKCDADYCSVSGKDKAVKVRAKLTPATTTTNKVTKVASSQTTTQYCSLTKAKALTKAKSKLDTTTEYKGTLKIPIISNIYAGDLIGLNIPNFPKGTYYIDELKENIDDQTYELSLVKGKNHLGQKYSGNYIITGPGGLIKSNTTNPYNAKCSTVNTNIGLKGSNTTIKKIKLKGQQLGTVPKIYKWLKIKSGGGSGGWKYKSYSNHLVKSENVNKFGTKSAQKCWKNKTANCCDFSWIMAMMGKGAGKNVKVIKGTYTYLNGATSGHMYNKYGTKYYDCSSNSKYTINFKKVEEVK